MKRLDEGDKARALPAEAAGMLAELKRTQLSEDAVRDLNKRLGLAFPLEGPRTLNGLVLEHFEDIPEPGTSFRMGPHKLEVIQTQDRIVKSVRIYP